MQDRRRAPRMRAGYRLWLAPPHERWAMLIDVSNGGLRVAARGLTVGDSLVVRRELGDGLSEARVVEVVYSDGHRAGLRYRLDRTADLQGVRDRRAALRIATRGLTAWIRGGALQTPAVVRDVSATGARIEPLLPLKRDQRVRAELVFGDVVVGARRALVVRSDGEDVGLRFVDVASVTP